MATLFNGNGSIPFTTSATTRAVAINSTTNASPISVYTGLGHGFNTGDTVEVQGETGNTAANGVWQITVQDANHFTLNGSTGNGADTGSGYVIGYEVQPAFSLPSPGDAASMVTLGPVLEGLANAIPFLNRRCGKLRLVNQYFGIFNTTPPYTAWSTQSGITTGQFGLMPSSAKTAQSISDFTGVQPVFLSTDWIDLSICFSAYTTTTSGQSYLAFGASVVQSGSSIAFGGGGLVSSGNSSTGNTYPLTARILLTPGILTSGVPVSFAVGFQADSVGSTSTAANLIGPYTITAYQYRGN